jgi:hypothetical protein
MEDVGIFYGHLVYFTVHNLVHIVAIWYILWLLVLYYSRIGML